METVDLAGTRIRVVLPDPSCVRQAVQYFDENRRHLAPTDPVLPKDFYSNVFWEKRLGQAHTEFKNDQSVRLFIQELNQPERFIGSINFTQISRGPFQACYLGYSIDKKHEGKGIMFEALQLAIRFMFEVKCLHRIMANYLPENARSARVLARLGFHIDGNAASYLFINGAWRDHVLTSLTNPAWAPRQEDAELFS